MASTAVPSVSANLYIKNKSFSLKKSFDLDESKILHILSSNARTGSCIFDNGE